MTTPLRIESRTEQNGTSLLSLTGEVDVANAPDVKQAAVALSATGNTRFVVDLSGVTYMDSSGLGTLVGILKRLKESGGKMAIAGASPQVRRLFDITGLNQVFALCDDVPSAMKEVGG